VNFPNYSVGLLDKNKFSYIQLTHSKDNSLPVSILVQGNVFNEDFTIILYQVPKNISWVNSQIYMKNNSNITKIESNKMVKISLN
jgi:hypothetical protein